MMQLCKTKTILAKNNIGHFAYFVCNHLSLTHPLRDTHRDNKPLVSYQKSVGMIHDIPNNENNFSKVKETKNLVAYGIGCG